MIRCSGLLALSFSVACALDPRSIGDETVSGSGSGDGSSGMMTDAGGTDAGTQTGDEGGSATSTTAGTDTGGSGGSSTGGGSTTGSFASCDELLAAFEAETLAIRGCTEAAECGQVLQGTSCGCTRDWVARLDADTTMFWSLVEIASEMQCEIPFVSTCDCPQADGYACVAGPNPEDPLLCTWNYI